MLPDVALLRVFDFYLHQKIHIETWFILVHVCRKWRTVIFGSPRRLGLQLYCGESTPAREKLYVWPPLPIIVSTGYEMWCAPGVDNIIAALEHSNRIYRLKLYNIPRSHLEKVLATMQRPFPILTHLELEPDDGPSLVVPASFLGGSAPPCLRSLRSNRILILPHVLLTATRLVNLYLQKIPHSEYFSPEALVTCLAEMTALKRLKIEFECPRSRPSRNNWRPPLPTHTLLPVLTHLRFRGVREYMEDLMARIDTPLLDYLTITLAHQLAFATPQLTQFITRTPKFKAHNTARLVFSDKVVWVKFPQTDGVLELGLSYGRPDWLLWSLAQVCCMSVPRDFIHAVEYLYIVEHDYEVLPRWANNVESSRWLGLLHPFTALKDLYVSQEFVLCIPLALQELVRVTVTGVLPVLKTLFLEKPPPSGPVKEAIQQFVSARQLASHPIAIARWEGRGNFEDSESFCSID